MDSCTLYIYAFGGFWFGLVLLAKNLRTFDASHDAQLGPQLNSWPRDERLVSGELILVGGFYYLGFES